MIFRITGTKTYHAMVCDIVIKCLNLITVVFNVDYRNTKG